MSQNKKLIQSILSGCQDKNILFVDLCSVLGHLGFAHRVRGDHFIFTKDNVEEIINIQPAGNKAKPYQVKQVRELAGCMADGKTPVEAVKNAEVVIQEWLETAVRLGRPIPEPKGRLHYA